MITGFCTYCKISGMSGQVTSDDIWKTRNILIIIKHVINNIVLSK